MLDKEGDEVILSEAVKNEGHTVYQFSGLRCGRVP